ncbi:MAG TPA: DUF2971 domain-containing protein [Rhizomicrobium sp.]|jgi:hypothetical protein|nr:DUF2971 domain-containing protein [Rhizomicrobium sp.]
MTHALDDDPALPQELWPAADEIRNWIGTLLLADQKATEQQQPLYHYTDETALKSILAKEEIWCFSHLHQTDKSEFSYSLDIARETLQEIRRSDDWFEKYFAICVLDLVENNSFTEAFEFYLFSASRHRDDDQQWQTFGKNGHGYAIGLGPTLFRADQTELSALANENKFVGNVLYGEEAIRARHESVFRSAAKIVSKFERENKDLVRRFSPAVYLAGMAKEVIAGQLIWNCLTGKNRKFQSEQEVRFLILGVPSRFESLRREHASRKYVTSALPLKTEGSVTEIIVGINTPSGSEKMMSDYLAEQGYAYRIPLIRSGTTLPAL